MSITRKCVIWILAHLAFGVWQSPLFALQDCNTLLEPAPHGFDFTKKYDYKIPPDAAIGRVIFTGLPVFDESDPRESNGVYRLLNRFHPMTQDQVVESILLFKPGDRFEPRLVQESERLLRSQKYLYDARIRPVSICDPPRGSTNKSAPESRSNSTVNLEVITRDIWSFTPEISAGRSGGENTYRLALRDTNIMGSGKQVTVARKKDRRRTSNEFTYKDSNVLGSRVIARLTYRDADDGDTRLGYLQLPFYALDSRQSWGVYAQETNRDDAQYYRGQEVSSVQHNLRDFQLHYGKSKGLEKGRTNRWSLGYRFREDTFRVIPGVASPSPLPRNKKVPEVFVAFEQFTDNYQTVLNLNEILRTEDIHIGRRISLRAGYANKSFGADQNRMTFDANYHDTIHYDGKVLWRQQVSLGAFWNLDSEQVEDLIFNYNQRYFRRQSKRFALFASANLVYTQNLNSHRQVLLGGFRGLRGFGNEFMTGDRSYLITVEERLYTNIHIFNLARVGWAVFLDAGKAWQHGSPNGSGDRVLANAGFGLRLASTKADVGRMIHVDFAFPLSARHESGVDSSQITVNIKDSF